MCFPGKIKLSYWVSLVLGKFPKGCFVRRHRRCPLSVKKRHIFSFPTSVDPGIFFYTRK